MSRVAVDPTPDAPLRDEPSGPRGTPLWLTVLVPAVAMAAIGAWGLGRGWWYDEVVTVTVADRSVPDIVAVVRQIDAVHAAYYLLMHVWLQLGGGEVWSRVPSLAAAVASAGLLAALGRHLVSARAGLVAGLLFAMSPFVSMYAQEARSYTLVGLAVLAGSACLVRALEVGGRWWIAYPATMAVATTLHEFAALAVAAHAVTLLLARPSREAALRWAAGAAVVAVALVPLVLVTRPQVGQVVWLSAPTTATVRRLALHLTGSVLVVSLVVVALMALGCSVRGRGPVRPAALALPLVVLPAAVLLLASLVSTPVFGARYVFYAVIAVCLLAGAGAERLLALVPGPSAVAVVLAAAVLAALFAAQLPRHREERSPDAWSADLAGAAAVVERDAQPGDGVLFFPTTFRTVQLGYPGAFAGVTDVGLALDPVAAGNLLGADRSLPGLARQLERRQRVWVVGRLGSAVAADDLAAVRLRALLVAQGFVPSPGVRRHGVTVQLFSRAR